MKMMSRAGEESVWLYKGKTDPPFHSLYISQSSARQANLFTVLSRTQQADIMKLASIIAVFGPAAMVMGSAIETKRQDRLAKRQNGKRSAIYDAYMGPMCTGAQLGQTADDVDQPPESELHGPR